MRVLLLVIFLSALFLSACSHRVSPTSDNISGTWVAKDGSAKLVLNEAAGDTAVAGYGIIRVNGPEGAAVDSLPLNGAYHDNELGLTFYEVGGSLFPYGFIVGTFIDRDEEIECTIKNMVADIKWRAELEYWKKK